MTDDAKTAESILVVDVGNTNICLGVQDGRHLRASWRIRTDPGQTQDEFFVTLAQLMETHTVQSEGIQGAVVASVVPPLLDVVVGSIRRRLDVPVLTVGPGLKTGITIRMDNPREVGADRIVNAVAAVELCPSGAVVVDLGTATTFDCVSPDGEYLGGIIAPGLNISAEALVRRTAKLPEVTITRPDRAIGKNTESSMQSGIFYGYVALIDGLVDRIREELEFDPVIIATGGHSAALASASRTISRVEPGLTLLGLALIWEKNRD
ncbi:MAG: type III pantothenate kinase [Deltaproteobacteria bacterium]|nr:type III pantothenate kinase [Deltaproteobacteria bacterium]